MKYKNINSALHNFADSFTSDSNVVDRDVVMAYLARRAIRGLGTELTFNIATGTYTPLELGAEPVAVSIAEYAAWFPQLLESERVSPDAITSASIRLQFHVTRVSASDGFPSSSEMPVDCVVTAIDDRGRKHCVSFRRCLTFYDSDPDERPRLPHSAMR